MISQCIQSYYHQSKLKNSLNIQNNICQHLQLLTSRCEIPKAGRVMNVTYTRETVCLPFETRNNELGECKGDWLLDRMISTVLILYILTLRNPKPCV